MSHSWLRLLCLSDLIHVLFWSRGKLKAFISTPSQKLLMVNMHKSLCTVLRNKVNGEKTIHCIIRTSGVKYHTFWLQQKNCNNISRRVDQSSDHVYFVFHIYFWTRSSAQFLRFKFGLTVSHWQTLCIKNCITHINEIWLTRLLNAKSFYLSILNDFWNPKQSTSRVYKWQIPFS